MSKKTIVTLLITGLMIVALSSVASAQRWGNRSDNSQNWQQQGMGRSPHGRNSHIGGMQMGNHSQLTNLPPAVEGELSQEVVDAMIAGWLDEAHAYNTYQVVLDQFGEVYPFINIQRSEEQHMSAWTFLFDRYGIDLPEMPAIDTTLEFASLSDACQIAADAEIANFGLYDEMMMTLVDYPDMTQVVTHLRDASEFHHLPAFESCAG